MSAEDFDAGWTYSEVRRYQRLRDYVQSVRLCELRKLRRQVHVLQQLLSAGELQPETVEAIRVVTRT